MATHFITDIDRYILLTYTISELILIITPHFYPGDEDGSWQSSLKHNQEQKLPTGSIQKAHYSRYQFHVQQCSLPSCCVSFIKNTHRYKATNTQRQVKAPNKWDSLNRYANRSDDFLFFITVDYLRAENLSFQTFCFLIKKKSKLGLMASFLCSYRSATLRGSMRDRKKKIVSSGSSSLLYPASSRGSTLGNRYILIIIIPSITCVTYTP